MKIVQIEFFENGSEGKAVGGNNHLTQKRRWENAFQKWSDEQSQDELTANGKCGYGEICGWCEDNNYGRPCVRALNAMCREKGITINYTNYNFEEIF